MSDLIKKSSKKNKDSIKDDEPLIGDDFGDDYGDEYDDEYGDEIEMEKMVRKAQMKLAEKFGDSE